MLGTSEYRATSFPSLKNMTVGTDCTRSICAIFLSWSMFTFTTRTPGIFLHNFVEHRRDEFAGSTPVGIEVDNDRFLRFQNDFLEIRSTNLLDGALLGGALLDGALLGGARHRRSGLGDFDSRRTLSRLRETLPSSAHDRIAGATRRSHRLRYGQDLGCLGGLEQVGLACRRHDASQSPWLAGGAGSVAWPCCSCRLVGANKSGRFTSLFSFRLGDA